MNFRQLLYFSRIAETQNITRAAETLNVAQTALGYQIRNLEAELHVSLIERHSRGIRLTDAGELFARRIKDVFVALDAAVSEVRNLGSEQRTPVNFGVTPSIMAALGTSALSIAEDFSPSHEIKFIEALSFNLVAALLREELDFALAFNVPERPGIKRTAILEETLFLVAPPSEGMNGVPVTFAEVIRPDLALVSKQDVIWNILHETANYLSLPIKVAFEVQSTSAIKTLVERGVASSVMPYSLIAEEAEQGILAARPIDNARVVRTLFLIHPVKALKSEEKPEELDLVWRIIRQYADALGKYKNMIANCSL